VSDRQKGISQQMLADLLGMFPSRLVLILDELEQAGLIERRASPTDRRIYALHLTALVGKKRCGRSYALLASTPCAQHWM
jgi:DNA-binding MarR family transcriptional regulator